MAELRSYEPTGTSNSEICLAVERYIQVNKDRLRWVSNDFVVQAVTSKLLGSDDRNSGVDLYLCRIIGNEGTLRAMFAMGKQDGSNLTELWDVAGNERIGIGLSSLECRGPMREVLVDFLATDAGCNEVRTLDLDQTNSAITIGDFGFAKFYRRVTNRPREPHLYEMLKNSDAVLKYFGSFVDDDGDIVALVIERIRDSKTVADVLAELLNGDGDSPCRANLDTILNILSRVGALLGLLHDDLAKAQGGDLKLLHKEELRAWFSRRILLRGDLTIRDEPTIQEQSTAGQIPIFQMLDLLSETMNSFEIHGDFHLGQVVWNAHDLKIIDFEGEPIANEEELEMNLPDRDLAGLLRSVHYLWFAFDQKYARDGKEAALRLSDFRSAVLEGYLTSHTGRQLLQTFDSVVRICAFELDKALYERRYEEKFRPTLVRVPVAFLMKSLDYMSFFRDLREECARGKVPTERFVHLVAQGYIL